MNESELELWAALAEITAAFHSNDEGVKERAYEHANFMVEEYRVAVKVTLQTKRRGIRLDELPTGGQGQVLYPDTESRRNMIKPAEGDDIPAFLKRQAE